MVRAVVMMRLKYVERLQTCCIFSGIIEIAPVGSISEEVHSCRDNGCSICAVYVPSLFNRFAIARWAMIIMIVMVIMVIMVVIMVIVMIVIMVIVMVIIMILTKGCC